MYEIHQFITVIYIVIHLSGFFTSIIAYNVWFPLLFYNTICEGILSFVFLFLTAALASVIIDDFYAKYRQRNRDGELQEFIYDSLCYFTAITLSGTILRVMFILNDIRGLVSHNVF